MAITRAQQAKQMLQGGGMLVKPSTNGKRPGYKAPPGEEGGPGYVGPSSSVGYTAADDRREQQRTNQGRKTTKTSTFDSEIEDQTTLDDRDDIQLLGGDKGSGLATNREENIKKLKTFKDTRPKVKTGPFKFLQKPFQKFSDFTTSRNRKFFEDVIRAGKIPGVNFATLSDPNFNLEKAYQDYMSNRLEGKTDAYGNPTRGFSYDSEGNLVGNFMDNGGPDPIPFIPPVVDEPKEIAEYINPLSLLTPRIAGTQFAADGGRIGAMNGGIMNVEDLDREAFLLGGIAKGLKKAVRGVKKLVKSPVGKVALLAAGAGYGGFGPLKGLFSGVKGAGFLKSMAVNKSLLGTADYMGGPTGILDLIKANPFKTIAGISALSAFMTPKEEEDNEFDIAKYYAQNQLNPNAPLNKRIAGSEFYAADGGRIDYQEGGDAEPVAKKTMPLLDMDGKEKDYRETGGFVDMGRMERADDVPARLSKNEFVFTADAVRNAGEGDIDKGAEVMYNMMKNLEAGGEVSEESQGLEGARRMFQTSQRLGEVI